MAKKKCYGVIANYSMDCADGEAVCRRGKLDLRASDKRIERAARGALKRIDDHYRKHGGVDSGAGPFCIASRDAPTGANPVRKLVEVNDRTCSGTPRRDLEFDTISLTTGLTRRDAAILAKAIRKTGAKAYIKPDACHVRDKPRGKLKG